jgi:hypothetical protein
MATAGSVEQDLTSSADNLSTAEEEEYEANAKHYRDSAEADLESAGARLGDSAGPWIQALTDFIDMLRSDLHDSL